MGIAGLADDREIGRRNGARGQLRVRQRTNGNGGGDQNWCHNASIRRENGPLLYAGGPFGVRGDLGCIPSSKEAPWGSYSPGS
jgi:hypothetical protein